MQDFDFQHIAPRCGGESESFEELCCQLARRTITDNAGFTRLHGAGGDGGVECYADPVEGGRVGWQAKYVSDIDSLLTQTTLSLSTALKVHTTLTRYVVCFPFDLTGPTARRGRSGVQKFDEWRKSHVDQAAAEGRTLTIEAWPASKLRSLIVEVDTSGGIREFFFNHTVLSPEWFSAHVHTAQVTAGPRYTAELNVETTLGKWFSAFGRRDDWSKTLETKVRQCRRCLERLTSDLSRTVPDPLSPAWPEGLRATTETLFEDMRVLTDACSTLHTEYDSQPLRDCIGRLADVLERFASLEADLVGDLEAQHGPGNADSPGFRQFMAEIMVSFPAANLDHVRDVITLCSELHSWLQSPEGFLAFERTFVLAGTAGSGKTHGVCDLAGYRLSEGLLTLVVFGHMFGGEPDPWTRMLESLGLPAALGMDGLLDALNAAAEASGFPLIVCVDAINETRPLSYWRNRLAAFSEAVQARPHLRLCVTCRTSFVPHCLPDGHGLAVVEHHGFVGVEQVALKAFFQHYGIKPPVAPILQPEMSNPLYLRLVCDTLRDNGLDRLPAGWSGLSPVIRSFLEQKEVQFSQEHGTNVGANIVRGGLQAIVKDIVSSGESSISWTRAEQVVSQARPQASGLAVVDWLVRADLLIEDAPSAAGPFGNESVVRPAFERLGDFLIAAEMLERILEAEIDVAFRPDGLLHPLVKDDGAVIENNGVISALSIMIPERMPGKEIPSLVDAGSIRSSLLEITVQSFPWRDPSGFSEASCSLLIEGLENGSFLTEAMDAALSISWRPSAVDSIWLDTVLKLRSLAKRDAWWCGYLHHQYEAGGPVRRLVEAAFELPLAELEIEVAERWATILLWFAAAADLRVKDHATRAAVAVLCARSQAIPNVLARLLDLDDDAVKERALLSCYAVLIISRDIDAVRKVTGFLQSAFGDDPTAFDNALLRDHIRCIAELAREIGVLPDGCNAEFSMESIGSEWPLVLPSDQEIERWGDLPALAHSCLRDDFFIYSMGCLQPWGQEIPGNEMGKWILKSVADRFGYEGSGAENYDRYMLGKHGGGRAKPTWAERIGKKYQWVAMYQLASRLQDHANRVKDDWQPAPKGTPLILMEQRKLDPTLPPQVSGDDRDAEAWWIGSSTDLESGEQLSDVDWVKRQDDLPTLEGLLSVVERDGQRWRTLMSYPSWGKRAEEAPWDDPYREVWVHIKSYIIPKEDAQTAYGCLHRRNFFGEWMPSSFSWAYGFAGEYPWGTPFNTESEEWHGQGRFGQSLPVSYMPSHGELTNVWEYDASLPRRSNIIVPARKLFSLGDLWWDGRDGYRLVDGKTVFRDPSITEGGPAALVADADNLLERLNKLGLSLLWTLLGEKWILGGSHSEPRPSRIFSQIARLEEDGSVSIGDRVFFEDYEQDTGPLSV